MIGLKHFLKILPLMILISIISDVSITAFLNPCNLNAGGAAGLSRVLSQWTGLSFAILYGLVNAPILVLSVRYLRIRYSCYTVCATGITTVLFPYLQPFSIHLNPMIAAMFGAVLNGVTIGLTYRYDFSLGGFALLAKVLEVITHKRIGTIFTAVSFVPVVLAGCTTSSKSALLWSVVFIVVSGEIINWTTMGKEYIRHCKMRFGKTMKVPMQMYNAMLHHG